MDINWRMGKQNVVYLYHGMLFSHKNEHTTDLSYNMNKSQRTG